MPRILGVDVPNDKAVWVALTYVYGIGTTSSDKILNDLGINRTTRARDLSEEELARIAAFIEKNFVVEGQLRRQVTANIGRLRDIGSYRGLRHRRSLPVRGQRTRCNARSRKGPKKTIANRKIARK
ncbi:MAG: 30S ribosomal protein S13 [Planctomycetes bacterium]|jgi:small subunit ribosomal protein S13|nr:30S ribosomal protein S13 [Planctomycetota bacterium]